MEIQNQNQQDNEEAVDNQKTANQSNPTAKIESWGWTNNVDQEEQTEQ
ncbi:hypothetical protein [Brevibacillus choshinensis]|uniref:Uncharacterized protein n=1 Tax=Brevibacillus choshinensis TaxID=54911 RepID=A0ABX7FX49_BRECH|nr:hypothetical protein [Brevibacillus choshinensis]QRG70375.1 hypothetical protein JNE38_15435 [Brevibacillus choshinensis]